MLRKRSSGKQNYDLVLRKELLMENVGSKMTWWKTLLIILAIVAVLTAIIYLEVYMPVFRQLEETAVPGATAV